MSTGKINFTTDEGTVEYYILDETRISGCNYILVADSLEDEAEAMILKDISKETDTEALYITVEDEAELGAVADVFAASLGDVEFE